MQPKLLTLCFLLVATLSHATSIQFLKGDLNQVKALALQENKPFFVTFTASWCLPCRQMEKDTYTDPHLAYYVSKYYLAAKVDVDDFDGYNYKVQYDIRLMPTMLIFSPQGEVIARYEQSMSANTMKQILARHNVPYKEVNEQLATRPPVAATPAHYYRPAVTRPALQAQQSPTYTSIPSPPIATGQGLYRLSVRTQKSSGYSVQLGMFEDYDNLLTEIERLDQMLRKAILVHIGQLHGKKVYKVLAGDFKTKERAILYRNQLKKKGLQGFIRNLSLMK